MGYSDDTVEFNWTGRDTTRWHGPVGKVPTGRPRVACGTCGNSNITALAVDDEGWWFECRRCGHTTMFTDADLATVEQPESVPDEG